MKKTSDIGKWTTAFHIFITGNSEIPHPKAIGMLRYCERVREVATHFTGDGWIEFDRQARLRLAPGLHLMGICGFLYKVDNIEQV